jgi:hypothetical protein
VFWKAPQSLGKPVITQEPPKMLAHAKRYPPTRYSHSLLLPYDCHCMARPASLPRQRGSSLKVNKELAMSVVSQFV